ncbi:MAG: hypothetical protein ACOX3G_08915 [Armatimonadota bacterium]
MNKGGFSWKRLIGVTRVKQNISRKIGIPLTRSGRQRKLGAAMGCITLLAPAAVIVAFVAWVLSVY